MNERSRPRPIAHHFSSNPGESLDQCLRRLTTEMIPIYNEIGLLQIDKAEYERLPDKQTETQVNDEILNEVLISLEKYLKEDSFLYKFGIYGGSVSFIAAYFKGTQMKTSSLSSAMIEAALTTIINRINDEQYAVIQQLPFMISYTDEDESRMKGVRVFQVKKKEIIEPK